MVLKFGKCHIRRRGLDGERGASGCSSSQKLGWRCFMDLVEVSGMDLAGWWLVCRESAWDGVPTRFSWCQRGIEDQTWWGCELENAGLSCVLCGLVAAPVVKDYDRYEVNDWWWLRTDLEWAWLPWCCSVGRGRSGARLGPVPGSELFGVVGWGWWWRAMDLSELERWLSWIM